MEAAWGVFALANVAVMLRLTNWETIPFHLIWVSLTILYGYRVWSVRSTLVLLSVVGLVTGFALTFGVVRGHESFDEVTEVPLMSAMFLAMVWHARHRLAAVERAERLAASEHRMLEAQREFVRDASHVLRTPITVARGHAELIRVSVDDPQVSEDADVIVDELGRLSAISEGLLLLAAAEDREFLRRRRVAIGPFLAQMARRWRPAADREWQVGAEADGQIDADPEHLEIALDALIENAVEATTPGDRIRIATRWMGGALLLEVSDTGRGIPSEELPRIFDRFARGDGVEGGRSGTGLGLAIARAIIEAHGGRIQARSRLGEGTTFTLELPVSRSANGHGAPSGATALASSGNGLARSEPSAQHPVSSGSMGRNSSE